MPLLFRINRFLVRTGMTPTRFGRNAINDPRLVADLERGREPRADTVARVEAYIKGLRR